MELLSFILIAVSFFLVAILCSNIGSGGGILYVPILLALTPYSKESIVMASLLLTLVTVFPSFLNHMKQGHLEWKIVLGLTVATIIGEVIGCFVNLAINKTLFRLAFAALLFAVVTKIIWDLWRGKKDMSKNDDGLHTPGRQGIATGISVGSGMGSSIFGISGGILNVPVMRFLLGRKIRVCVGTSFLIIALTNPVGIATYSYLGVSVPWEMVVLIGCVTPLILLGSYMSSRWGLKHLKVRTLLILFITLVSVAGFKILIEAFQLLV